MKTPESRSHGEDPAARAGPGLLRSRRDFLKETLAAVAVGGAGLLPPAPARSAVETRTLARPIQLKAGEKLEDVELVLAEDFQWDTTMAAIFSDAPGIKLRNVKLRGSPEWQSRWNEKRKSKDEAPGGIPSNMAGIRLQKASGAVLDGVDVAGFPREGITGFGLDDAVLRNLRVTRCFVGLRIEYYAPTHRAHISQLHTHDMWGPSRFGQQLGESKVRPGNWIGGDGFALNTLRDSIVEDCSALGEQYASFKLVNPQNVTVRRMRGISLMVQGTADMDWKIHKKPSSGTKILDSTFDKALGAGAIAREGNGLQISMNVADLLVKDCTLKASGQGGHGLQVATNAHARIEGCTFEAFNGMRKGNLCYAIDVQPGCSINDDFEAVNTFVGQKRLIRRA